MEKIYKLVLYSKTIYKEVELSAECKQISIGTYFENEVRLKKDLFFEHFFLTILHQDGVWEMECSSNVYINGGDVRKLLRVKLNHGDEYGLRYQGAEGDFLMVSFRIDFDYETKKYDDVIPLPDQKKIVIGFEKNYDIYLRNPYIVKDCVVIKKSGAGLLLAVQNATYGVCVNGIKVEKYAELKEGDFFSIANYYFYYKEGKLFTDLDDSIVLYGLSSYRERKESCFAYPSFNRSTRLQSLIPEEPIGVLDPPEKPEKPKNNLLMSILPSVAMLVLTVLLRGVMSKSGGSFVIFSVCTISIGIVTSVVTFLQGKKEYETAVSSRESKYRAYIQQKSQDIQQARDKELEVLNAIYPGVQEIVQRAENFSRDLFDRRPEHMDFLCARMGTGRVEAVRKINYKKQERFVTEDELMCLPETLTEHYKYLMDSPIILSLRDASAVGVVGNKNDRYAIAKNVMVDLMGRHYMEDVTFVYIMEESQKDRFSWIRYIPQTQAEGKYVRNIACDADSKTNVFENLYKEFSRRMENQTNRTQSEQKRHILIFVLDGTKIMTHPLSKFIPIASSIGATFLFFEENKESLPICCTKLVYAKGMGGTIVDAKDMNQQAVFTYQEVSDFEVERMAKYLAPIYCQEVNLEGGLAKSISLFELLGIYCVEDLDLTKRWAAAKTHKSMAAPLGVKTKNELVSLDIHEKAHGPHGLVAGTTGSGKSEILQSYILSMATLYHPYEVGFLIIDFKGGGMANQFLGLPHLLGTITNIDGKQIDRSLLSIKAELLKRQNYFAEAEVNHIDKYIMKYKEGEVEVPLPHLIIIVDEFAELKAEFPDFMKELISAARIGRSLGVHLILATQKPSGQVNEQIWSNSRFKLCLKVQSPEDSNEMIKSPLAAEILEPGRAYFQVGNNEIFELFQSGFSGAPEKISEEAVSAREYKISEISFEGKRECVFEQKNTADTAGNRTQLEAMVAYIGGYCGEKEIQKLGNICLPPLPETILYPKEVCVRSGVDILVDVGILDDPNRQRQEAAWVNFTQENVILIGSSQYGKTNLLQTVIRGLASAYSPQQVNLYILDFGSMVLRNFDHLRHVGGVVVSSEDEKFKNLMKLLLSEIAVRKDKIMKAGVGSFASYQEAGNTDLPQIILMIDNFTAVKECYLQEEDPVMQICREGLSVGISVIISNSQTAGLGYRYLSNFSKRLVFYCNESGEYSNVIERCRIVPDHVAGRALTEVDKEIYELQTYLSFEGEREIERVSNMRAFVQECNQKYTSQARRIPEIPEILEEHIFAEEFGVLRKDTYTVPLGLSYDSVMPVSVDLLAQGWFAVMGQEHAGKRNLLNIILNQLCQNLFTCPCEVYLVDSVERELSRFQDLSIVKEYTIDASDLVSYVEEIYDQLSARYADTMSGDLDLQEEPLKLVVVGNMDAVEALGKNSGAMTYYRELLGKLKSMKVCFIYMNLPNVSIAYNAPEILKSIKETKNLFFFDDLQNLKVCDVSAATVRKFKKKITLGDCYWMSGNEITKIKTAKSV